MKKYARVINEETKLCEVGLGTNIEFYKSMGMTEMDVEHAYNGDWYVTGYAPEKPAPTHEEQSANRERAYKDEVDPITCHINRLRDIDPVPQEEIDELLAERNAKVEEIRQRYPYNESEENANTQD